LALRESPVVLVQGPRQAGKTTLVRQVAGRTGARYLTLDDAATLAAASRDAQGFVTGLAGPVVIDEVQRVPELLLAIKLAVDQRRDAGRFLLTGSAHVLSVPKVADALVGRMQIVTLWPFSRGEIEGRIEHFVDGVFGEGFTLPDAPAGPSRDHVLAGGFPEAVSHADPGRRQRWFAAYLTTVLQREVRELAAIEGLTELPRVLSLLASRSAALMNSAELSRATGLAYSTLRRYLSLLEAAFLLRPLPAWSGNLGKRLTRSPKVHLSDSGLAAHLVGAVDDPDPGQFGSLLESFVCMELRKQAGWAQRSVQLFHFRTHSGAEVDIVLEEAGGRIAGIEVKGSVSLGARDVRGLETLRDLAGPRFVRGVVLYGGNQAIPLGDRIFALPVSALWTLGSN